VRRRIDMVCWGAAIAFGRPRRNFAGGKDGCLYLRDGNVCRMGSVYE
jgi:hypothetical protein